MRRCKFGRLTIARDVLPLLVNYPECLLARYGKNLQIEEMTSTPVMSVKKEASAIAGEVADKVDKVTTPVLEAVASKRVSSLSKTSCIHRKLAGCPLFLSAATHMHPDDFGVF